MLCGVVACQLSACLFRPEPFSPDLHEGDVGATLVGVLSGESGDPHALPGAVATLVHTGVKRRANAAGRTVLRNLPVGITGSSSPMTPMATECRIFHAW